MTTQSLSSTQLHKKVITALLQGGAETDEVRGDGLEQWVLESVWVLILALWLNDLKEPQFPHW